MSLWKSGQGVFIDKITSEQELKELIKVDKSIRVEEREKIQNLWLSLNAS